MKSKEAMRQLSANDIISGRSFETLQERVKALYYAANWTPDRPVDATKLWTDVRDAAYFPKGSSPEPIPFDGIQATYPIERLRQIGHLASAKSGKEFGTAETRAFLLLYESELKSTLDAAVRQFFAEKLG